MPIKAVLFDLDNTVLDRTRTLELYLAWQADDYLNLSHDDCEQFIERFMKLDNNGMTAKEEVYAELISVFNISDHTADELTQIYREQLGRFCCEKRHIKDAVSTIKSHGFKTGIVSNGKTPFQENKLSDIGMTDDFDTIVVSDAVSIRKPDAEIFKLACYKLGVTTKECVFVGDNPVADIEGANNVGMFSVFIPSRHYPACANADAICRDLRDLPAVVAEANSPDKPPLN